MSIREKVAVGRSCVGPSWYRREHLGVAVDARDALMLGETAALGGIRFGLEQCSGVQPGVVGIWGTVRATKVVLGYGVGRDGEDGLVPSSDREKGGCGSAERWGRGWLW